MNDVTARYTFYSENSKNVIDFKNTVLMNWTYIDYDMARFSTLLYIRGTNPLNNRDLS